MDQVSTLPNLFIIGAAKSGTTSLHNYLNGHSDIFMCNPKEPHFLINNEIGKNRIPFGISCEKEYLNLFLKGGDEKYRGESSVMYLMYPEIVIPKLIKKFGKECKIIIMLRNPIDRAYSGFQHVKRYNTRVEEINFRAAWNMSEERYLLNNNITPASRYKELGMYYKQVKAYLHSMKNVHVIIYDDYQNDFQNEINKVFDFLNVQRLDINSKEKYMIGGWKWRNKYIKRLMVNKSFIKTIFKFLFPLKSFRRVIRRNIHSITTSTVSEISKDDREMVKEYYKEDIAKLSELLNRDLNYWLT